jgi:hypothetical protein
MSRKSNEDVWGLGFFLSMLSSLGVLQSDVHVQHPLLPAHPLTVQSFSRCRVGLVYPTSKNRSCHRCVPRPSPLVPASQLPP